MKKILLIIFIASMFIGCGGGAGDTTSSKSTTREKPKEETNTQLTGNSFDMWDYIIPTTNKSLSISSNSEDEAYHATFRSIEENNLVEEIPQYTTDERIVYDKGNNKITVIFYKNDKIIQSYDINRVIRLKEQTIAHSACFLVDHFNTFEVPSNGKTFNDVIEIACGSHSGYYAKGKGEIYKE